MSERLGSQAARQLAGDAGGTADTSQDTSLLIDAKAAARLLNIGARTLWSLTNREAIPSCRIGRSVRYSPNELRAWIAAGCPTVPGSAERVREAVYK